VKHSPISLPFVRTIASNSKGAAFTLDMSAAGSHTAGMSPELEFTALLPALRDALGGRRILDGFRMLEKLRPRFDNLEPRPGAGVLTGLVAQWVDAGFDGPDLVSRLLGRFPKDARPALPLLDYLHLRMAEGVLSMFDEEFDAAAACFQAVLSFQEEVADAEMFAIANYWTGRCFRKRGRYDEALEYTGRGERLALSCGYTGMAAIIQVTLSWLAFQKGRLHEATAILRRAEEALAGGDDYTSRGNVQSAYGRIARRQGKYDVAIGRFECAIQEFRTGGGAPLQLARTLVNLAFVKRLVAVRAQKELDTAAASRRGAGAGPGEPAKEQRARIEQIRQEARACLAEAGGIYQHHQNHRGIAGVEITDGFLRLDSGDLERAAADAAEAFTHGSGKSDLIVMARARTLQCIVENANIEEQLGDPAQHREAAEVFAREAVGFAGRTENRRLLARALVWQGLTYTAEPADLEAARRCCDQATALLQPEGLERQYIWDDLEMLKGRVLRSRPIDRMLRAWCAGIVEGQSFQQITEEFAQIVIPRVWEREGRKVSKVAEKLSISPKKVRRILHAARVNERPNA
jgi:tetratricopeptide (TPR) repeat protein